MADRTYRWLLISLAVIGLSADQISKYGMFKWLYKDGQFAGHTGNEYDVVPGWFKFIAQFDPTTPPSPNPVVNALQTWSAPEMPRVNHGALFGIGGGQKGLANGIFAVVSVTAAIAILVWGMRQNTAREKGLMVETRSPDAFYSRLPEVSLADGMAIKEVYSDDDSLEAVFKYLVNK